MQKEIDILVFGASGFTGRLVTRQLKKLHADGNTTNTTWGIAGRNPDKLRELIRTEQLPGNVGITIADSNQPESLAEAIGRARVVLTTVGPYAKYGSDVVRLCAELGVHYCDLTGEVHWMRRMIDQHQITAEKSGARIVHTCGFDSIPSDIGVYFMQKEMQRRHGVPARHVKYRASDFKGGFSGGTLDSMWSMAELAERDASVRTLIEDPYALDPATGHRGLDGPDHGTPEYDPDFNAWVAPFVMAQINTRVVRRSNALLNYAWGRDFRYDEGTLMPTGPFGFFGAAAMAMGFGTLNAATRVPALRELLQRMLPKPGEGPSAAQIENGFFRIELLAKHPTDTNKNLKGRITGDKDPGYGATSKMLTECALALARDESPVGGGFWTPATALGESLLERLPTNAGVRFELVG
jgi:short subunit dehydrogenase-like uncharacterized protein